MDPNATLAELRSLTHTSFGGDLKWRDSDRAVELFDALDEWLSRGGFLPSDWARA